MRFKPALRFARLLVLTFLLVACAPASAPADGSQPLPFGLLNVIAVGVAVAGIGIGFLLARRRGRTDEAPGEKRNKKGE